MQTQTEEGRGGWSSSFPKIWDHLMNAIRKGVVGFFRQSSMAQRRRNVGSQKVQEEQVRYLEPFGVHPDEVTVVLAYGESGKAGVVRQKFRHLTQLVTTDRAGLILLARYDRLSRNSPEARDLFAAMEDHGTLLMVDGRIYDPTDPDDKLVMEMYAAIAEYENNARSRWMALAKFAKARLGKLRIALPTGLVWADETLEAFREAMVNAQLDHLLDRPELHKVGVPLDDGHILRVLPYPDAEVQKALRLFRAWLFETRSLAITYQRIVAGYDGWPRPGEFPVSKSRYPYPHCVVTWQPIIQADLYGHLQSPAMFGSYVWRARSLIPRSMLPRKARRQR